MITTGKELRAARESRGLHAWQLGLLLDLHPDTVLKIENGDRTLTVAVALAAEYVLKSAAPHSRT